MFQSILDLHCLHTTEVYDMLTGEILSEFAVPQHNFFGLRRKWELKYYFDFTSGPIKSVDAGPVLSFANCYPSRLY